MTIGQSMLPEFDQEMGNTRKMLERIPEDKLAYKPDPKSWSMIHLASHVAEMVGFVGVIIHQPFFDLPEGFKPFVAASRKEVLDKFDEWVKDARPAIAGVGDQALMQEWSLRIGGNPITPPMPRIAVLRSMIMNHMIHHRAQLSVYYRLNGVPVPGMYGPSADEGAPAAAAGH
jgi:uncharacterized damage-inducible protein DinB